MLWGDYFMAAGVVLYTCAAAAYYVQGVLPLALVYLCYAGANVGLVWLPHWRK